MEWREGKFSEVPAGGKFRDPAFPAEVVMERLDCQDTASLKGYGEAVIVGAQASPTYTFGPNKVVLISVDE